jgi:hypothetical protein
MGTNRLAIYARRARHVALGALSLFPMEAPGT